MSADERTEQPYARSTCSMPVSLKLALLAAKESPCAGCEQDRKVCGGEPKAVRS